MWALWLASFTTPVKTDSLPWKWSNPGMSACCIVNTCSVHSQAPVTTRGCTVYISICSFLLPVHVIPAFCIGCFFFRVGGTLISSFSRDVSMCLFIVPAAVWCLLPPLCSGCDCTNCCLVDHVPGISRSIGPQKWTNTCTGSSLSWQTCDAYRCTSGANSGFTFFCFVLFFSQQTLQICASFSQKP